MATCSWGSTIKRPALAAVLVLLGCSGAKFPETLNRPMPPETPGLWKEDLGRALETAPVVDGNRVYVTVTDKKIACRESSTGAKVWEKTLEGAPITGPVLTRSRVLVATGYRTPHVHAFDAKSGEEIWKESRRVLSLTALPGEDRVVTGLEDGRWECLDANTGEPLWTVRLGTRWCGEPAAEPGRLWVPFEPDSLAWLDPATGERKGAARALAHPLLLAGNRGLWLLDPEGRLQFRAEPSWVAGTWALQGRPAGLPAPDADAVWVALRDGRLVRIAAGGDSVGVGARFPSPLTSGPVVSGTRVYQALPRGQVAVLDAVTAQELARWQHAERLLAPPAVAGELVLVPGSHGTLVAHDARP